MKKAALLILFSALLLINCHYSPAQKTATLDGALEDPEHHIKDSGEISNFDDTILYTGLYRTTADTSMGCKRMLGKQKAFYYLNKHPVITVKNFTTFTFSSDSDLLIGIDKEGKELVSKEATAQIYFILDNQLLQVVNRVPAPNRFMLSHAYYSKQELENFKEILKTEK